ncbi:MAG TPA: fibronectin type III domain-containing protein [Pilimelia sp.]|nr:fibronectin type III domain-containing protein [Pilimelia sp.]
MARSFRLMLAVLISIVVGAAGAAPPAQAGPAGTPSRVAAIPPPGPATPTELIATNTTSSITLSWTQPTWGYRPTHFRVYEGSTVVARNTTTRVTVQGLGFGSTHTFRITAVAANGLESMPSDPITRAVWIPGIDPNCRPGPPTGLRAFDLRPSAVSLAWDPVDPPAPVQVSGAGQTFLTRLSHARIGGLVPATTYTLAVARRDCRGQYYPATVTITTPAGSAAHPGTPTAVTVSGVTATTARLSWTAPTGGAPVSWYEIYRGGHQVTYAAGDATSVELTGLWRANTYPLTVTARGADGSESVHSAAVAVTTLPCDPAPPAPTALTASVMSASSVALHWISEIEANSFTVYDGSRTAGTVRVPSAMITGLASRSGHQFSVVADLAGCGHTPISAGVAATTRSGPRARPTTPINLWQVPLPPRPDPNGTVVLAWTQPPSADPVRSYRIYEGATVLGTSTTTTFSTQLPPATTHFVSVVAVDAAGNESRQSVPISVIASFVLPP